MTLLKRNADSVVLVFDADAAGQKAAVSTGAEFLAVEMPVRVATLPDGEDPDSLLRTKGPEAFQACLDAAESITSFQIRCLRAKEANPEAIDAVTRVSRAVLQVIAQCPSAVMRASLMADAARLLGLPMQALEEDLSAALKAAKAAPRPAHAEPAPAPAPSIPDTPESTDAASPVNNPPSVRELALCAFLFKHEKEPAVVELMSTCAPQELFAHGFTRGFVQAWLAGDSDGRDEFAVFCRSLSPEEGRWFDRISSDERDSLCDKSPESQLKELLRLLWVNAVERLQGQLSADDPRRITLSVLVHRLQLAPWSKIRPLMTAATLARQ